MSNNLFSLFLQRHIGTFFVSDRNRGTTTIIRGNGALKKIEELTLLGNNCTAFSAGTFINAY